MSLRRTNVTPIDLPMDEPAAFVHHINSDALSKASTAPCLSPTLITDKLISPLSKRSKPTAQRAASDGRSRVAETDAAASADGARKVSSVAEHLPAEGQTQ